MDIRYKPIVDELFDRLHDQLGDRLKSAFIKGSVARGDALWGVSDLDFVVALPDPTRADSTLKQELEATINARLGYEALIIQRIWHDRLENYDAGTRAYWLYSCRHDIELLYGLPPAAFLPEPPSGQKLVKLIAPIIYSAGAPIVEKPALTRFEIRLLAKRTLQALALPAIATGQHEFMAPLKAAAQSYTPEIDRSLELVRTAYCKAPAQMDPTPLQAVWLATWFYLMATTPIGDVRRNG